MNASVILSLLRFLPAALEAGIPLAAELVQQVTGKVQPKGAIEEYAAKVLEVVPAMIAGGVATQSVIDVVTRTNEQVGVMIREVRGPTDAEWSAQAGRIKALEDRLDQAARRAS